MTSSLRTLALVPLLALAIPAVQAQDIRHNGAPESIISSSVVVPLGAETIYVSGMTAGRDTADLDTEAQARRVLQRLKDELEKSGFGLGDVVMMRAYLVGVPANGGRMDSAGWNKAYRDFFGTAEQPHKPARATIQVAALGSPTTLVEVEVQAARKPAR
jgi:Putative translation initiation inhibitor, yjgF family